MSTVSVISVVDDDASVRAATSKFLRSHGYTVQAYSSAEHFLQSGRLNDTSCVIADLQMPGMSGLELLTMMRAQGYGAPFIFITAFPDETSRSLPDQTPQIMRQVAVVDRVAALTERGYNWSRRPKCNLL